MTPNVASDSDVNCETVTSDQMERGVPKGSFDGGKADELKEVFKTFVHGLSVRVNVFIDPLWLQSLQSANPTVLLEFSLLHSLQPCLQDEDFHIFLWIMFSPMEVGRQFSVIWPPLAVVAMLGHPIL